MIRKNLFSIIVAAAILFLSFTGPGTFSSLNIPKIPYLDKLVHAGMYFTFMLALIIDNRATLKSTRNYLILSAIPFVFGSAIEIFQSLLTKYRTGDILDACFNLIGIVFASLVWIAAKRLFPGKLK